MDCTGYKLRKHIAKALQARSQAIRTSLERYNAAALSLSRPKLTWEQVVEYAFLAEFDLLREGRMDVRNRPWAKPASRLLMDRHFKIERAREEIQRLNIEIPRVVTYIQDEKDFLLRKEKEIVSTDAELAHQVRLYREERGRFDNVHMRRFYKLARLPGFTGGVQPGVSVDKADVMDDGNTETEGQSMDIDEPVGGVGGVSGVEGVHDVNTMQREEEEDQEAEEEQDEEDIFTGLFDALHLSVDS